MVQKSFISVVATVALGIGIASSTSVVDAKQLGSNRDNFRSRADHYAYPDYYELKYGFDDCRYRWVLVKKWNKAHTKLIKVSKKRWLCY